MPFSVDWPAMVRRGPLLEKSTWRGPRLEIRLCNETDAINLPLPQFAIANEALPMGALLRNSTRSILERLFAIPWLFWSSRIHYPWRIGLANLLGRAFPSPHYLRPLTDQQRRLRKDEFIASIDTEAISALASKHHEGLSCSIRSESHGSFNVCFVVDFVDGATRLVRVPIEPAIHDVWGKVCSEVCTLQ